MANIKSAKKRILVNRNKAFRNQMQKSQLKTVIKKFNNAVESGDKALATELYRLAVKKVDHFIPSNISCIKNTVACIFNIFRYNSFCKCKFNAHIFYRPLSLCIYYII